MKNDNTQSMVLFAITSLSSLISFIVVESERAEGGTDLFTPSTSTPLIIMSGVIFVYAILKFAKLLSKKPLMWTALFFYSLCLIVPIVGLLALYYAGMV